MYKALALVHSPKKKAHKDSNISDWIDLPTPNSSGTGGGGLQSIRGGGGKFSGAGASGSFDAHSGAIGEGHVTSILDSGSGAADSASGAVGEAAGALADECFIFAALAAIIITILGSAIYIVSEAHVILSEAAFEGLLAASLIRKTRLINEENWIGSIFKTTWKPFALTLLIAFVVAAMLHSHFPAAKSLSEIIKTRI